MKRIYQIINIVALAVLTGVLPTSCNNDGNEPDDLTESIHVATRGLPNANVSINPNVSDNTFTVLFWAGDDVNPLVTPADNLAWEAPYLAAHAPQPVGFYEFGVFDTRYPYPDQTTPLYATGYSPGEALAPDAVSGYRRLTATVLGTEKGRYDFLGCDVWKDVFKGSRSDPFANDKNKLYFRHLDSKLVFYADRDKKTMENKQFVRNVSITQLYMSIDGGKTYTPMHTPCAFEWQGLEADDFTTGYNKAIEAALAEPGNAAVAGTSRPTAGYKTISTMEFAGPDHAFELQKHATDRVPVSGMTIDSCYVSNPVVNGVVQKTTYPIRLRMDISAELSFDPDFPQSDGNGSTTDDLTYTHTWHAVELNGIYQVDEAGKKTNVAVNEFKPGMSYHVYIHFHRKGVNAVAIELPWNVGGVHYLSISGADPKPPTAKTLKK